MKNGNHLHLVIHVGGARRGERRHGAGLGDALFENLAVLRLLVVEEHLGIVRLVKLPLAGIDAELAEQRFHAEGAGFVRNDGHHVLADFRVLHQQGEDAHERHGARHFTAGRPFQRFFEILEGRRLNRAGRNRAAGHIAAQLAAPLVEVRNLGTVGRRPVERGVARGLVRDGDFEARTEVRDLLLVELLLLVGDVAAFARLAQAVALDGVGQDERRLSLGFDGGFVGVIDLARIVAAAAEAQQVVVAQVGDEIEQLRVLAEEVLADVSAVLGDVRLELAVHDFAHALLQQAGLVARQQVVPILAPDHLEDVPAGAAEGRLELLDHLAVAAHRAVEALQVAVDDEDQVVELFPRGQGQGAHRFRLVHFAVAREMPRRAAGWEGSCRDFPGSA